MKKESTGTGSWGVLLASAAAILACGGTGSDGTSAADAALLAQAAAAEVSAADLAPICGGTPETITGVVESANLPSEGLTLDTGSSSITFYGLGPTWYWTQANLPRPVIGDTVSVVLVRLTTTLNDVALAVTVNGQRLALRDAASCLPLWRSTGTSGTGEPGHGAAHTGAPAVVCDGSTLPFSGVVSTLGAPEGGLTLSSSGDARTFLGLGPAWYWDEHLMSRPVVGDWVDLTASRVASSEAFVVLSITIDGDTLDLRDAGSCVPLW